MSTLWEMTTKYVAPTLNGHPISKHVVREIRRQILNRLPINVHGNTSPSVKVILIRQQHPILGQTQLQTFGSLSSLLSRKDLLKTAWIRLRQDPEDIEGLLAMYAIPRIETCAYLVMESSWIR
jgi:hypothetical protein